MTDVEEPMTPAAPARGRRPSGALRVGLIGSGKMGLNHVKAIKAAGDAVIVGVADPAASEEELRPHIGPDAIVVARAAELLERARPDVVHIVTPPGTHAELAEQAIRAGCHVYVEKPFTPTAAEAARLLDLAAAHGVTVCAGHQVLYERPAREALASLDTIGRLVHIESYFSFKMVRRTITASDQVKDILPHAVYPVVEQLRAGTRLADEPIELTGLTTDADGEVYALLKLGRVTAVIMVTLNGRPIESYQTLVGTNGSFRADYIAGALIRLTGPGTGPGVLFTPYRRAWQTVTGATRGFYRLIFGKAGSYQGLHALVQSFYTSVRTGGAPPFTPRSILDTVAICEQIGKALDASERAQELDARTRLEREAAALPPLGAGRPRVLVTGGTGLLGRTVAEEMRQAGFPVRIVARRVPPYSRRLPGVEYAAADLARGLTPDVMTGVDVVVHCAAETAGGQQDHRRNSIDATRQLVEAAAAAGARRVVHISSIAILKTSREMGTALDESTPVDAGHMRRGPYVWGKAESELVAAERARELGVSLKIVRPGPLVDYAAFQPPGRLGRELGPWYVGIGPKRGALSVCDVSTAARVLRSYVENFEAAPPVLNLVEAPPPERRQLLDRYLAIRPDLRAVWMPAWVLRAMSGPLKLLQRVALGSKQPFDVAAAFASERYRTDLAADVIRRAGAPARDRARTSS